MAHHGANPESEALSEFFSRGQRAKASIDEIMGKLGATGRFPEGKLASDDEGEIQIGIAQKDGKIILAFGKSIAWAGMTPEQAEEIGQLLIDHGRDARLRRG